MWRVNIWTNSNDADVTTHKTKEAAYQWANDNGLDAYAIEIYGPDGFYDGVE